ncbi:MAG: PepSY-associated TM helix domain-containing protein [Burkholderiales bacterium]
MDVLSDPAMVVDDSSTGAKESVAAPQTMTDRAPVGALGDLRHRLVWRLHFWAGLLVSPLVVIATVTGLIYVFSPQIEAWRHASLDRVPVAEGTARVALEAQIDAARSTLPGVPVRSVFPALAATDTTKVVMGEARRKPTPQAMPATSTGHILHQSPAAETKIVSVNPYTGVVVGVIAEGDRFKEWSRKLHSTLLQGESWRWLIELAASWTLVMLLTGLYLWWPKPQRVGGQGVRALIPRMGATGPRAARLKWRDWHAVVAIIASLLTFAILLTGLTWSKYTGENFRAGLNATGQSAPKAPEKLQSQRAFPEQSAWSTSQIQALGQSMIPSEALQLTPPRGETGVWRISTAHPAAASARKQLVVDQYSGQVLWQSGWNDLPLLAKATAVGIPFHRGEFGWWNQVLLVFVGMALLFSVVSGYAMWWKRRPPKRVAAPAAGFEHWRALPWWIWPLGVALGYTMPVFGLSLALFLMIDAMALALKRVSTSGGMT